MNKFNKGMDILGLFKVDNERVVAASIARINREKWRL